MKNARYKTRYADDLIAYFNGFSVGRGEGEGERPSKAGKCVLLPSFIEFAHSLRVLFADLQRWRRTEESFSRACVIAEEYLRALILEFVLRGEISPANAKYYFEEVMSGGLHGEGDGFEIKLCFEDGENEK